MTGPLIHWLKLHHAPGLGPAGVQKLLKQFGNAGKTCDAGQSALLAAGAPEQAIEFLTQTEPGESIEAELRWAEQPGHHIVTFSDNDYPSLLKNISDPPCVLYIRGNKQLLSEPQLAIVGSRNPTHGGQETAYRFAEHLSKAGLLITSGLATGIDSAAHRGALAASAPTIAVMATGADHIYPSGNTRLAEQILQQGALITEMPLGTRALPRLFPRRNRIISGLSLGTLVVEAALRSGSLISARLASEQAREVFAIPGSIHNPLARGCHQLLKSGAKLVESVQDILEELAPQLHGLIADDAIQPQPESTGSTLDREYQDLLNVIDYAPLSVDHIVERSGLSAQEVASMLLILELKGYIRTEPGGCYNRVK